MEVTMPYSYTLTATIPASPQEVYEAWLDSVAHSQMTGASALMSDEPGAEVSAWDNYITGRNVELVPGERIVQSWRTSEFDDEHEDSIVTLTLEPVDEGTLLTLEHSNVPDEQRSYEEGGWQENYFEPMVAYFTERREEADVPAPAAKPPKKAARKAAPKAPARRKAKSAAKVKRPRPAKKRAAPRAKKASAAKKRNRGRKTAAPKRRSVKSRRAKSRRK
jgi:uncharacterized protein YndB with AHSA1/START domain